MKTPGKLREELSSVISTIQSIERHLRSKSTESMLGVGIACEESANKLKDLIANNRVPDTYKVAIVGRFKAGKSSFVNELLEVRLAGEDTSPETAAVTTFSHGHQVEAAIKLVSKEEWVSQKKLFEEDASHVDAHRAKVWHSFSKPKKTSEGQEIAFDLNQIESELLQQANGEVLIRLDSIGDKKAERAFREKLKEFTTANKPYHCLVKSIQIKTPAPMLQDGVELIDTPGLDDTERFRVSLTEESVEDVDSILFLTKSGASYGQSEKDFLLSLLRKGTIQQLIIVVTQVDHTYEQHVSAATDGDVDLESVHQRISKERLRIRGEIEQTLRELVGDSAVTSHAYAEQFSNVDIVFTSVLAHRDFIAKREPKVLLSTNDPGGVMEFRRRLSHALSRESRLAVAAKYILRGARETLNSLTSELDEKIVAVKNIKDKEVVERKLHTFRDKFGAVCKGFEGELSQQLDSMKQEIALRLNQHKAVIENIVLRSEKELDKFRTNDVGRHWRTRRSGYWGYMHEFQARVANKIFPRVQDMLNDHVLVFTAYVEKFEVKVRTLTTSATLIAKELELGSLKGLSIDAQLKNSLEKTLLHAQEQLISEQDRIIRLLDSFISEEVERRISDKRSEVAEVWGRGTTASQTYKVNKFYDEVGELLGDALSSHLASRNLEFSKLLLKAAELTPKLTFAEIDSALDRSIDNLRQAGEATVAGQKERAEKLIHEIRSEAAKAIKPIELLAHSFDESDEIIVESVPNSPSIISENMQTGRVESDWASNINSSATLVVNRIILRDGDTGWSMAKIFDSGYFVGANRIRLTDPYLHLRHQQRNLREFLVHVFECSKPKLLEIICAPPSIETKENSDRFFADIAKDAFDKYGVMVEVIHSTSIHDRSVIIDNGFLVKLGRGLDFYKPATGLAAHRQENRRVRSAEIDIFKSPR